MFLKKKAVTLRFITNNKSAFRYCKPDKSTKFLPAWWKELARSHDSKEGIPDMTHCAGFLDMYKHSITLPLWSDLKLEIGAIGSGNYEWSFSDLRSEIVVHAERQRGGLMPDSEYQHLKMHSPWLLECNEDINLAWVEPVYSNLPSNFKLLTGVTSAKYMPEIHVNFMMKRESVDTSIKLEVNQPLVHLVPLTEMEIKIEHMLVSDAEFNDKRTVQYYSTTQRFKHLLKYSKNQEAKCPFGFGGK